MRYFMAFLLILMPQWTSSSHIVAISVPNPSFDVGYGSRTVQNLNITPASLQAGNPVGFDGVYVGKFSVQNFFPKYPGYYDWSITFGTQELCSGDGWGTANVTDIPIACPSPQYIVGAQELPGSGPGGQGFIPPQGNQPLTLTFSSPGQNWWPVHIMNISLTFTPQPCVAVPGDC